VDIEVESTCTRTPATKLVHWCTYGSSIGMDIVLLGAKASTKALVMTSGCSASVAEYWSTKDKFHQARQTQQQSQDPPRHATSYASRHKLEKIVVTVDNLACVAVTLGAAYASHWPRAWLSCTATTTGCVVEAV